MKLAEFKKESPPGDAGSQASSAETGTGGEEYVTSTTPSGIEVYYSWAPRRHYKLRGDTPGQTPNDDWREVPSVTTVLSVLDRSGALIWWGQGIGVEGVLELYKQEVIRPDTDGVGLYVPPWSRDFAATKENITALLTEHKLTVNHVKDKAADRGVNVHGALEAWAASVDWPMPQEGEGGYFDGLSLALNALGSATNIETELMVGSLEHQYAGRFDLVLTLSKPVEVVTRHYPKRADKVEEIPAGRYLCDLKTSKRTYDSQHLQLQAYELAAVECGYAPTDHQAVIHVTADGGYEFVMNPGWTGEDFLAVRRCYSVIHERDKLAREREIEADLKALGATEVV